MTFIIYKGLDILIIGPVKNTTFKTQNVIIFNHMQCPVQQQNNNKNNVNKLYLVSFRLCVMSKVNNTM